MDNLFKQFHAEWQGYQSVDGLGRVIDSNTFRSITAWGDGPIARAPDVRLCAGARCFPPLNETRRPL